MKTLILYTTDSQKENTEAALTAAFGEPYRLNVPIRTDVNFDVVGWAANFAGATEQDFHTILQAIDQGAGLLCIDQSDTSIIIEEGGDTWTRLKTFDECLESNGFRRYNYHEHLDHMTFEELQSEAISHQIDYSGLSEEELLNLLKEGL